MRADYSTENIARAAGFVNSEVGKPYREGCQGPDAYDCGGIVRAGRRIIFGHDMAVTLADPHNLIAVARAITSNPLLDEWHEVEKPEHGAVVFLSKGLHPHHVGLYLEVDRGGLLHAVEGFGVEFVRLAVLRTHGWGAFHYHRYVGRS